MQKEYIDIAAVINKISPPGKHAGYDQIYGVLQKNKQLTVHSLWRRGHTAFDTFLNLAALYSFRWYFGNRLFTLQGFISRCCKISLRYNVLFLKHLI